MSAKLIEKKKKNIACQRRALALIARLIILIFTKLMNK